MGPSQKCRALHSVWLGLLVMSCGDSGAPTPPPTATPDALEIVSGNNQRTATSQPLAEPLRIRVTDSDDRPVAGATVRWSVTEGQATLDPAESSTDANGETETHVTVGGVAGAIVVRATVEGLEPVSFSINALDPSTFISVSAGAGHTCGVTAAADAYCWGSNTNGQLGSGTDPEVQTGPALVLGGLSFAAVSAGGSHTCGITTAGAAYCWGLDRGVRRPAPVPVAGGLVFKAVSAGGGHTCGLLDAGEAYCWGPNSFSELGDGTTVDRLSPVLVTGGHRFTSIGAGNHHTCGLTTAGVTYCWGANFSGQLGDGTLANHSTPAPVVGGLSFTSIEVGALFNCGVTADGVAHCWGLNSEAELAIGTATGPEICEGGVYPCSTVPLRMVGDVIFASAGGGTANSHGCGMTPSGAAYCWGSNIYGQLGNGTTTGNDECHHQGPANPPSPCSTVPVPVAGNLSFAVLSAGSGHTCGLTVTGQVYCWGTNEVGQLGVGTGAQWLTPVLVTIEGAPAPS